MRDLGKMEIEFVSGAGCSPRPPKKHKKAKGNNGFGNGGNDPAPGNSGTTGGGKLEDVVR